MLIILCLAALLLTHITLKNRRIHRRIRDAKRHCAIDLRIIHTIHDNPRKDLDDLANPPYNPLP